MPVRTTRHRSNDNHHGRRSSSSILVFVVLVLVLAAATSVPSVLGLAPKKIALVTGSNKGIGYEIARKLVLGLGKETKSGGTDGGGFVCILGCRSEALGTAAAERLRSEAETKNVDASVDVVTIDLMDADTIRNAASYIQTTYGRCDVLINNAAVCYNDPTLYGVVPHTPFAEQAEITMKTNFFGTLALTKAMMPLLLKERDGEGAVGAVVPRIINIASSAGRLAILPSEERRAAFSSESLTLETLESYANDFVGAAREGTHSSEGWPNTGYGVSKAAIIAMTKVLARRHRGEVVANSVDPGYCATDQNDHQGFLPAERGAITPYLLATLPADEASTRAEEFTGKHWYQEREIEW